VSGTLSVVDEYGLERAIAVDLPAQEFDRSHMDTFREPRQVARDRLALGDSTTDALARDATDRFARWQFDAERGC
jgi:hypothetical protein